MKPEQGRPAVIGGRLSKEMAVYDCLDRLGIAYERVDHEAAFTMEVCRAGGAFGGRRGVAGRGVWLSPLREHLQPAAEGEGSAGDLSAGGGAYLPQGNPAPGRMTASILPAAVVFLYSFAYSPVSLAAGRVFTPGNVPSRKRPFTGNPVFRLFWGGSFLFFPSCHRWRGRSGAPPLR